MGKINPNEIPRKLLKKAMECKTAEELLKLAEENGIELTKEEAEAYLDEFSCVELDDEAMAKVAGGECDDCIGGYHRY